MVKLKGPHGNFLSAMQVLHVRCPLCENFINWVKHGLRDVFYATCCGFVFRCGVCDNRNQIFHVTFSEADLSNVICLSAVDRDPPPDTQPGSPAA